MTGTPAGDGHAKRAEAVGEHLDGERLAPLRSPERVDSRTQSYSSVASQKLGRLSATIWTLRVSFVAAA